MKSPLLKNLVIVFLLLSIFTSTIIEGTANTLVNETTKPSTNPSKTVLATNTLNPLTTNETPITNQFLDDISLDKKVAMLQGTYYDVYVENNYLFFAGGSNGLIIYKQINDSVELVSRYDYQGKALKIWVKDGLALIADYKKGFVVIDVHDPQNPQLLFESDRYAESLFVENDLVYVLGEYFGLGIYALQENAQNFTLVNKIQLSGVPSGIFVRNRTIFVSTVLEGLKIFNASNPGNISLIGNYSSILNAHAVFVKDNYALVGGLNKLTILNVTDLSNPSLVTTFPRYTIYDVKVSDNYAFLSYGHNGMSIVNITDYTNPIETSYFNGSVVTAYNAFYQNDSLFVAGKGVGYFILDVTDPANPSVVYENKDGIDAGFVKLKDNMLYVVGKQEGLYLLNVKNMTNPEVLSFVPIDDARRLDVTDYYAYVCGYSGIYIINVTNPLNPLKLDKVFNQYYCREVLFEDNYAFVTHTRGVLILNTTIPWSPTIISMFNTTNSVYSIALKENYLFIGVNRQGLKILNITDITHPSLITSYGIADEIYDIVIKKHYTFLACSFEGLKIADITNLYNIRIIGTFMDYATDYLNVYIRNNIAFVSSNKGLILLDISELVKARKIMDNFLDDQVKRVVTRDNYIIISGGERGVEIYYLNETIPPNIHKIYRIPSTVIEQENISIYAEITDYSGISQAYLYYRVNQGEWVNKELRPCEDELFKYYTTIGPFNTNDTVQYYVKAQDNSSSKLENIEDNNGEYYSFVVYKQDNVPPLITDVKHEPEQVKAGETVKITAQINDSSGIYSATLYFKIDQGAGYGDWFSVEMKLENENTSYYSAIIGPFEGNTKVKYYIKATDDSINRNEAINDNNGKCYYFFVQATSETNAFFLDSPSIAQLFLPFLLMTVIVSKRLGSKKKF